jgi:hypothetical protein
MADTQTAETGHEVATITNAAQELRDRIRNRYSPQLQRQILQTALQSHDQEHASTPDFSSMIDTRKTQKDLSEIEESDYFKSLQEQKERLRGAHNRGSRG